MLVIILFASIGCRGCSRAERKQALGENGGALGRICCGVGTAILKSPFATRREIRSCAPDHAEHVVEIMSNAASELAQNASIFCDCRSWPSTRSRRAICSISSSFVAMS